MARPRHLPRNPNTEDEIPKRGKALTWCSRFRKTRFLHIQQRPNAISKYFARSMTLPKMEHRMHVWVSHAWRQTNNKVRTHSRTTYTNTNAQIHNNSQIHNKNRRSDEYDISDSGNKHLIESPELTICFIPQFTQAQVSSLIRRIELVGSKQKKY